MELKSIETNLEVFFIEVDCKNIGGFVKSQRDNLLSIKNMSFISKEMFQGKKKIYLHQKFKDISDLPDSLLNLLKQLNFEIKQTHIKVGLEHMSVQEVLSKIIPSNITIPTSFEIVGTLIHMNLRPEHEPYKKIIGEVILQKNPSAKTVVNKTEKLNNIFRTPELEIIAGENNFETEVHEGNCIFEVDYSKVYWNSRLQNERDRVLKFLKNGDVLLDLFCGVGPLSIRAAKKGVKTYANDMNPECFHYLKTNAQRNNVKENLIPFNLDAKLIFKELCENKDQLKFGVFKKIYMNLPGDAINFVDIFNGMALKNPELWENYLPEILLYTFIPNEYSDNLRKFSISKLQSLIPNFVSDDLKDIHEIRDISSKKKMYCLHFQISHEVAFSKIEEGESQKKIKT